MFPVLLWYIYTSSCFRSSSCPVAHLCDRPALMCCTCCLPSPGLFKPVSSPPLWATSCSPVWEFLLFSFVLCAFHLPAFVSLILPPFCLVLTDDSRTHLTRDWFRLLFGSVSSLCLTMFFLFLLDLARHKHILNLDIILYQIIIQQRPYNYAWMGFLWFLKQGPSISSFQATPCHECKARVKCF